jgi:hypothetical protein
VVLTAAAIGYQVLIPTTHVVRTRLARLAVTQPGVAGFNVRPAQAAEQPASQTQLTTVESAATRSPDRTGVYAIEWTPSESEVAGLVVILLPSDDQAATALSQLGSQQLGVSSYAAHGLKRQSTFTVGAVPGASGATFAPSSGGGPAQVLAVSTFRDGRAVALSEVLGSAHSQADTATLATNEYAHLQRVQSGFSLNVVTRPTAGTVGWATAAVVLAGAVALGPAARTRSARRRQARLEEELSHRVIVRGQVISKRRR